MATGTIRFFFLPVTVPTLLRGSLQPWRNIQLLSQRLKLSSVVIAVDHYLESSAPTHVVKLAVNETDDYLKKSVKSPISLRNPYMKVCIQYYMFLTGVKYSVH
jgi:hypothetical protein